MRTIGVVVLMLIVAFVFTSSQVLSVQPPRLPLTQVLKVIDGDTLDVLLDGEEIRVRLLGIDTPERGQSLYYEAKERLQELAGARIYLEADDEEQDRYGRYLFWIWSEDGLLINAQLVEEGLADCYYRPSFRGRKHAGELLLRALEACGNKVGIWSKDYGRKLVSILWIVAPTHVGAFFLS